MAVAVEKGPSRTSDVDTWKQVWLNEDVEEGVRAFPVEHTEPSMGSQAADGRAGNGRPLPNELLARYVRLALHRAALEWLSDGSGWYAHVPLIRGAYGQGDTPEEAITDLASAIRDWVLFKMRRRHGDIPRIGDIDLNRG